MSEFGGLNEIELCGSMTPDEARILLSILPKAKGQKILLTQIGKRDAYAIARGSGSLALGVRVSHEMKHDVIIDADNLARLSLFETDILITALGGMSDQDGNFYDQTLPIDTQSPIDMGSVQITFRTQHDQLIGLHVWDNVRNVSDRSLYNSTTGLYLGPATILQAQASDDEKACGDPKGVIDIEGVTCFVA